MHTVASTTRDDVSLPLTVAAALLLAGTGGVLLRRRRDWFAN
jgi:LPXTG-motif cell wall-anchored protein